MSSRKRPHGKTVEDGHLQELQKPINSQFQPPHGRGVDIHPETWGGRKRIALLPIPTNFGQCYDLIICQSQAIFQLFSSYPPLGRALSSQLISMRDTEMAVAYGKMFICSTIVVKSSEMEVRIFVSK